jgi:hypothetical protein
MGTSRRSAMDFRIEPLPEDIQADRISMLAYSFTYAISQQLHATPT